MGLNDVSHSLVAWRDKHSMPVRPAIKGRPSGHTGSKRGSGVISTKIYHNCCPDLWSIVKIACNNCSRYSNFCIVRVCIVNSEFVVHYEECLSLLSALVLPVDTVQWADLCQHFN